MVEVKNNQSTTPTESFEGVAPKEEKTNVQPDVAQTQTQQTQNNVAEKSKVRFALDAVLLLSVIIVSAMTFLFFARPTVQMGDVTHYGETQSIVEFVWGSEDSISNQMEAALSEMTNIDFESDNVTEEESATFLSVMTTLLRLFLILIPVLVVAVMSIKNVLMALLQFFKHNTEKLTSAALSSVTQTMIVYVFFAFFGGISGGIGDEAYYVGYTVSAALTAGILVALAMIIAVAVATYFINRHKADHERDNFDCLLRSWSVGIGYMGIAMVLTSMRIYSIFKYVFSSTLSILVLSIQNGFDVKSFIFPTLNIFLFLVCIFLYLKSVSGFIGAFKYLLLYGEDCMRSDRIGDRVRNKSSAGFGLVIVASVLSVAAIYVLRNPSFGYGWSVDIYTNMVRIFIISAVAQTLRAVFKSKKAA